MTPTLLTPTPATMDAAASSAAFERVVEGPWSVCETGQARHAALHLRGHSTSADTAPEWYTRPLVVTVATTTICAAFWGTVALGAAALF